MDLSGLVFITILALIAYFFSRRIYQYRVKSNYDNSMAFSIIAFVFIFLILFFISIYMIATKIKC